MHARFILTLLGSLLLGGAASAGPMTVLTKVMGGNQAPVLGGNYYGEIPVEGLGNLTWVSGSDPMVIPAGLTVGEYNSVALFSMQFSNQYQKVGSIPATPLQLNVQVWDGAYGAPGVPLQQFYVNATISGQISPNTFDWQFAATPLQAAFADGTVLTMSYQAISLPTGIPRQSGPTYYTDFGLEANFTVSTTPEPSCALLLGGLTLGGLVARRFRRTS